jgi:RNA polymerase sigma-70 factor (ECF subfamily)
MAEIPPTRVSLLIRLRDLHDEAAWGEFVALYGPLVYGYLRKQGLQDADAADLGQDILGKVMAAIGRLDYDPGRGSFRNWLFTIVRRKLSHYRAAWSTRIRGTGGSGMDRLLQQCAAPQEEHEGWEQQWQEQVFAWACAQVRRQVADLTWQAFWRTAFEDQTGDKVAADLGLSIAAVYQARSRVLARLKELVQSVQEP